MCHVLTIKWWVPSATHTAMHCNALQRNATHCNALQRIAAHCDAPQRFATHCSTLQHTTHVDYQMCTRCQRRWWGHPATQTATKCNMLQRTQHCNALQRTVTHCNTLPRTATHCTLKLLKVYQVITTNW